MVAEFRRNRRGREFRRHVQPAAHPRRRQKLLRVFADVGHQAFKRVVRRVRGPDDFIQRMRCLGGRLGNLPRVRLDFRRFVLVTLDQLAQQRNPRQVRAELVVQIARNARTLPFQRLLLPQQHQLPLQPLRRDEMHRARHDAQHRQPAQRHEPPRPPERRQHAHGQRASRFIPHPVLVARYNVETVMPRRQLGKNRLAPAGHRRPARLVPLQLITELRAFRRGRGEIQTRELEFQPLRIRRHHDLGRQSRAQPVGQQRTPVQQHALDLHRRRIRVPQQPCRFNSHQTADRRKPQLARARPQRRRLRARRAFARRQAIRLVVGAARHRRGRPARELFQ